MNTLRVMLTIGIFLVGATLFGLAATTPVFAGTAEQSLCEGAGGVWNGNGCDNGDRTVPDTIKAINNILIFITGSIAVIMAIIGGLRYVTSNGDASATAGAKNTILYAIVGIVVAFSAWAIINFVVEQIAPQQALHGGSTITTVAPYA